MPEPILITSALPYANGSIHLGHLVEYIQTDIFARFMRLTGRDAVYLCADDTHGSPIEINAWKKGITPEQLIERYYEEHLKDFRDFLIQFDEFYTTNSQENQKHAIFIFERLQERGHIRKQLVSQYFCEHDQRFLPDRYIRGTCPNCHAENQYGDVCESCGSTYETTALIGSRCAICGQSPVIRESVHYFFRLNNFRDFLASWISTPELLQPEIRRYIENWIREGLRDWDISRDGPYFGFLIPGETNKYFYVWLDAPVGYIATTEKFCKRTGRDFDTYWHNPDSRIIHVIGKDIIYFHTLFWPAMLYGAGYSLPKRIVVHGFLTINGEKMSKSRGTFITARTYLDNLDPQYLRYYYATKLSSHPDDIDLIFDDFVYRVNSELVNKIANLVSRVVPFVEKHFAGRLGDLPADEVVLDIILGAIRHIRNAFEHMNFNRAVEFIVDIAEKGNKYFQEKEPWALLKGDPEQAQRVCTLAAYVCLITAILLKPIIPRYSEDVETIFRLPPLTWNDIDKIQITGHEIGPFRRLVERVDPVKIQSMLEQSATTLSSTYEDLAP